ncbi:MAG TPA: transglutaminase family protein [Intrasporangium sp.]|uniref:transglutaminase-like domain-containing protein n=1 Tax=Intrasporangium sp. TaxID=1925024 RepID=UPI002D77B064|nr:transglutaminase family protein [Intrasporangium sp.]HET7399692.1 transglutaminase family protein [Intrasporangium sp.]
MAGVEAPGAAEVDAALELTVSQSATIVLQVALAGDPGRQDERLEVTLDGRAVEVSEVAADVGGRQHVVRVAPGQLHVRYRATISGEATSRPAPPTVTDAERIVALRPSRYCPADRALGLAAAEFANRSSGTETMRAICGYVAGHTAYVPGSSGPTTDAVETLLSGQGVCRDYAHAVTMLARAAGIPARLAAVYAPGLSPMDLHAVVEAAVDGSWQVWDATRLAPRPSLLRIATGRDAADTAFVTVLDGRAELSAMEIVAVAAGDLPVDDHQQVVALAT